MLDKNVNGIRLIRRFVKNVWPEVDLKLDCHMGKSQQMESKALSAQAISSLKNKRFHALGGSIYSLYPGVDRSETISFITAFQTISDYLDNLCDRAGVRDEAAYRQLHRSMAEAVDPSASISDYYSEYPYKADNGYLYYLVSECRKAVEKLPSYDMVKDSIKKLVELYSSLQALKHLNVGIREEKMRAWADSFKDVYPDVSIWEFSAAAGSTLGIFMLYIAAYDPRLSEAEVKNIVLAYFPWITGLHILLDYFIDSNEDRENSDLNFTGYYSDLEHCTERLAYFISQSVKSCHRLRYPRFHLTVIRGLLAMYLSDPKALSGLNASVSISLIRSGGLKTRLYHVLCKLLRQKGKLS